MSHLRIDVSSFEKYRFLGNVPSHMTVSNKYIQFDNEMFCILIVANSFSFLLFHKIILTWPWWDTAVCRAN